MRRGYLSLCAIVALCVCTFEASAASQLLTNGSFEAGSLAGWTATGNVFINGTGPNSVQVPASDGTRFASFNGGQTVPNATLAQSFTTLPGQTYTLSYDFGNWGNGGPVTQGLQVTVAGQQTDDQRNVIDSTINGTQDPTQIYTHYSYNFVADSSLTTLTFKDIATGTNSSDGELDNVVVAGPTAATSTPLPAGAWGGMIALTVAGFVARQAGRRSARA